MAKLTNISQLMDELDYMRQQTAKARKTYDKHKEYEDDKRDELMLTLQAIGLKSAKSTAGTSAIISERVNVQITHEPSVMEWIKDNPDLEADVYIGLKKTAFDPIAKQALKENGEVVPGTNIATTEYLSVRSAPKGKK